MTRPSAKRTPSLLLAAAVACALFSAERAVAVTEPDPADPRALEVSVEEGSSLSEVLQDAGFSRHEIHDLVRTCADVYDLSRIPAKTPISLSFSNFVAVRPDVLNFRLAATKALIVHRVDAETWRAVLQDIPVEARIVRFAGAVDDNLWDSARQADMDGRLVMKLASVFAWELDFNRELRRGDRWRMAVEELYVKDKRVGWGDILAVEYENAGQVLTAVRFWARPDRREYFHPNGSSVRRVFLKSPVEFGRVSSRFDKRRLHPIMNVTRPHQGVDYAAPTGTPILAVGDGRVSVAGTKGNNGLMVRVRHNSFYESAYKHMSKLGPRISEGTEVTQGQVIGYVGMTGLATGPHVHYELHENGTYIDPLGLKVPTADPIPENLMSEFKAAADKHVALLPPWTSLPTIAHDGMRVD